MASASEIRAMKCRRKIAALTSYDALMASIVDSCGIDIILVGDSVANVLLGYPDTKTISIEEMLHHVKAVARAKPCALIVGDMPVNTYRNPREAIVNAKKFIEAGCGAVKIEGYRKGIASALRKSGIEVMGHVGLLPQTAKNYKVKGRESKEAKKIIGDAMELDREDCFAIVLECIPSSLAKEITSKVSCPTIGIGAGSYCDGQILVVNDILGFTKEGFKAPKFVKRYANLSEAVKKAVSEFAKEAREGKYPEKVHSY